MECIMGKKLWNCDIDKNNIASYQYIFRLSGDITGVMLGYCKHIKCNNVLNTNIFIYWCKKHGKGHKETMAWMGFEPMTSETQLLYHWAIKPSLQCPLIIWHPIMSLTCFSQTRTLKGVVVFSSKQWVI